MPSGKNAWSLFLTFDLLKIKCITPSGGRGRGRDIYLVGGVGACLADKQDLRH